MSVPDKMTSIDNTSSTPEMPTSDINDLNDDMHYQMLKDAMTLAIERHMPEWSNGPREAMSRHCFHQHIGNEIVLTLKLLGYPAAHSWVMYGGDNKFTIGLKLEGLITMVDLKANE